MADNSADGANTSENPAVTSNTVADTADSGADTNENAADTNTVEMKSSDEGDTSKNAVDTSNSEADSSGNGNEDGPKEADTNDVTGNKKEDSSEAVTVVEPKEIEKKVNLADIDTDKTDIQPEIVNKEAIPTSKKVSVAEIEAGIASVSGRKASMADSKRSSNAGRKVSVKGRKASISPPKALDLDDVLVNELGQFGRFQFTNLLLVSIPIIMSAFMSEYIFSAAAIPHRCQIPECGETSKEHPYSPEWVLNAIPATSAGFASCERFESPAGANGSLDYCPANLFTSSIAECDGFVYDRTNSVVYDFDLGCQEWLRALAGTLNSVGTLLVLPVIGFISDKYGRRVALVISVFNLALIGLIRAFSVNYPMYLALQIIQTTLGAGTFSSSYIFAAELVGPKYRVVTSAVCSSMFAVGQVVLGGVAWVVQPWRYMIMTLHIPCFLIISYYWLLSESVRWLLSKQRWQDAKKVLEKVAKVNKKQISEKSLESLMNPPPPSTEKVPSVFSTIFKSSVLLRRVCTTPVWWITTTFVYYGLSINSTSLSDTMYLNYILTCAIEIPGFFTAVLVLNRIGRKATLCSGYMFSAACNIAFVFIDSDMTTLRLVLFLLGKFGISVVFTSLYLFTSELYPTQYRHSLLAFSSMIGRVGSITAPLTPVLNEYFDGLPNILFGAMGLLSGLLVLTQPETLGTKMPDTLAEAEALGQPESMARNN